MRLVYFSPCPHAEPRLGVLHGGVVVDLVEGYREAYSSEPPNWLFDLGDFLSGGRHSLRLVEEVLGTVTRGVEDGRLSHSPDRIIYHPVTARDQRVFGVPVNYNSLVRETGAKPPERPYIFNKFKTSLVGHRHPIVVPRVSSMPDYEVELGVVIGRRGKYVSRDRALDYVAGYTVFNDVSFRDWQLHPLPNLGLDWYHIKSPDSSTPVGPYLVIKDEIDDPYSLELTLKVNGVIRQRGHTSDMIFSVEEIIEHVSIGVKILPGDLIATGTPSGIGHLRKTYLKEGDIVEAEVSKIGTLINPVEKER